MTDSQPLDPRLIELGFEVTTLKNQLEDAQNNLSASKSALGDELKSLQDSHDQALSALKYKVLELERAADVATREKDKGLRDVKTLKEKLSASEKERKALKALDPERMKGNLVKTKSKYNEARELYKAAQKENQELKKRLDGATAKLTHQHDILSAAISGSDWLYRTEDEAWSLYLNTVKLNTPFDSIGYKLTALSSVTGEGHMFVRNHDAEGDGIEGVWLTGEDRLPQDIIDTAKEELTSLHTRDRLTDERTKIRDLDPKQRKEVIDRMLEQPKK